MAEEQSGPELQKADQLKRFLAFLIDAVIVFLLTFIPIIGGLVGAAYMVFRDGFEFEPMKGRSLGKKAMGLKPVLAKDGRPCDLASSFKRNWILAIGAVIAIVPVIGWALGGLLSALVYLLEGILVITSPDGKRIGDNLAETMVVEEARAAKA